MIEFFEKIVGKRYCFADALDIQPFVLDERRKLKTIPALVVMPKNVTEVQKIVKLANKKNIEIIPQGGNTGLVGGGLPDKKNQVIISLKRLNKIIEIDVVGNSISVEAGAILANIQAFAKKHARLFPLSLGAQESCAIGGNISTNAGGINVLSYGNMRDLVLGLEVITPQGEILNLMSDLRKDNTGIDLKNLFIGSEGTLGIITKAVLKLFPLANNLSTLLVGVNNLAEAIFMLNKIKNKFDRNTLAFEAISKNAFHLSLGEQKNPLPKIANWYLLVEINCKIDDIGEIIENENVVFAQSTAQQNELWQLRHNIPQAQKQFSHCIKTDIALPIAAIPQFVKQSDKAILAIDKNATIINYGHIGDGNLHYNIIQDNKNIEKKIMKIIYENVYKFGGSFSAEHGIGQIKKLEMKKYKNKQAIKLMKDIKKLLDKNNIMNPRKIL